MGVVIVVGKGQLWKWLSSPWLWRITRKSVDLFRSDWLQRRQTGSLNAVTTTHSLSLGSDEMRSDEMRLYEWYKRSFIRTMLYCPASVCPSVYLSQAVFSVLSMNVASWFLAYRLQSINQSINQSIRILLFIKKHTKQANNKSTHWNVTTVECIYGQNSYERRKTDRKLKTFNWERPLEE